MSYRCAKGGCASAGVCFEDESIGVLLEDPCPKKHSEIVSIPEHHLAPESFSRSVVSSWAEVPIGTLTEHARSDGGAGENTPRSDARMDERRRYARMWPSN